MARINLLFIGKINKVHPTIKFAAEQMLPCLLQSRCFLDITMSLTAGVIETDLYVKPTDSLQYLQSNSSHPFLTQFWS